MSNIFMSFRRLTVACSVVAIGALSLVDASAPAGAAAATTPNWVQSGAPLSGPSARYDASMVYDVATATTVLFGGFNGSSLAETWTWNGSAWTKLSPVTSPPALRGASMVYDTFTHDVVLFGGLGSGGLVGDTWTWDGTTWTKQVASGPAARSGATMVYDTFTNNVVLFGGKGASGLLSDTWLWNGTSWTLLNLTTASPSPRYEQSMAYDGLTHSVVLFGGDGSTGALGDTWTWDGTTWTKQSAASPSARYGAPMIYDATSSDVVLFGGTDGTNTSSETWVWNGTYWNSLSSTTTPSARYQASMAYDSVANDAVLFGGYDGTTGLSDTWSFDVAPGAPRTVKATSNANTQSVVTWSAPTSTGGSAILGYSVVANDSTAASRGGQTCATTGATTCTLSGLTNGDQYDFAVSAINAVGAGLLTSSNVVRPATVPGAPTITKVVPGGGQVTVDWSAPASTGGTPIASYRVIARPGGAFCHVPGAATSCRIAGLHNGTGYTFSMTATNAAGTGPTSVVSASVQPRTLPGAPIITSTSVAGGTITIKWKAPISNGGVRLIGYDVYAGPVSGGEATRPLTSLPFNQFSFTLHASKGQSVYIFLRAVNAAGIGPHSNQVAAVGK